MRVPKGPKYRTLVSQVRCEGDRNHHQASRQFQYPITPGVGDPCWESGVSWFLKLGMGCSKPTDVQLQPWPASKPSSM